MRKARIGLVSAVAMLLVMALGAPASAGIVAAGALQGVADVGTNFTAASPCTKEGLGMPTGPGLVLAGHPTKAAARYTNWNGVYRLSTDIVGAWADTNSPAAGAGLSDLDVCGYLTSVLDNGPVPQLQGLGAACGMSKGYNGKGKVKLRDESGAVRRILQLSNVEWKFSATFIAVTGKYQEQNLDNEDGSKGIKKDKWGQVAAVVQTAGGGGNCVLNPGGNGAQNFNVVGAVAAVPSGTSKDDVPFRWNEVPYFCKSDTDPACWYDKKDPQKPKGT